MKINEGDKDKMKIFIGGKILRSKFLMALKYRMPLAITSLYGTG
ncbi:hypothetical protein [Methanosarcina sp. 1.H.A.2.2]|nr:hypothetical protein [Methanosarcina sp. 1.H.A.2.2]